MDLAEYDQPKQGRIRPSSKKAKHGVPASEASTIGISGSRLSHRVEESGIDTSYYSNAGEACDDVTIHRKWKSYRANPGSIYDYDPTDYDTEDETEKRRKRPTKAGRRAKFAEQDNTIHEEQDDYSALLNYQSNPSMQNTQNSNTRSWMDYLQGEYKYVAPSNHIDRSHDILTEAETLVNISREQVNRAREQAAMQARQDEQENLANMYAKKQHQQNQHLINSQTQSKNVRDINISQSSVEQSGNFMSSHMTSKSHKRDVRLNLSSYGYTTDYTDFSESGYEQADDQDDHASATCDSEIESEDSLKLSCFMAMYPYSAQEDDELSFTEGDYLDECQFIGEGWMFGFNRRTGESGMLPANYVESLNM
jgi:hypothetical protein